MEYNGDKNSYKSQDTSPLSKTASRPKKYDVFLSHHRSDKEQVEIIAARLKDEVGLNPFLDKWRLEPGESWNEEIETALNNSAACAVFVGPHGPAPWQNEQMRSALHERINNHTLRVIPVLLERAGPLEEGLLPQFLQPLSWVDFRSGLESQEAFSHLVAGIRGKKYLGLTQSAFHKLLEWFNDEIDDQDSGGRKIHLIGKRGRSPMEKQAYNEELIVQYLLGSLPEEETERFDELCFVDDEFAEKLSAVENDLVDKYMQPLRALIGGATQILVSPDGALNLIPFEALVGEQDRYLIERYSFTYLTSGRDPLRLKVGRESKSAPLVFADPTYGEPQRGQ